MRATCLIVYKGILNRSRSEELIGPYPLIVNASPEITRLAIFLVINSLIVAAAVAGADSEKLI